MRRIGRRHRLACRVVTAVLILLLPLTSIGDPNYTGEERACQPSVMPPPMPLEAPIIPPGSPPLSSTPPNSPPSADRRWLASRAFFFSMLLLILLAQARAAAPQLPAPCLAPCLNSCLTPFLAHYFLSTLPMCPCRQLFLELYGRGYARNADDSLAFRTVREKGRHAILKCTTPHHTAPHHITPHHATPHHTTTPRHATPRHNAPHHTTPHHRYKCRVTLTKPTLLCSDRRDGIDVDRDGPQIELKGCTTTPPDAGAGAGVSERVALTNGAQSSDI